MATDGDFFSRLAADASRRALEVGGNNKSVGCVKVFLFLRTVGIL